MVETGNGSVLGVVDKTFFGYEEKKEIFKKWKRECSLGDKPKVHSSVFVCFFEGFVK